MTTCRCHCRACGAHFSSLEAFDAHRIGTMDARHCELVDAPLVERSGTCKVAGETPIIGITVYEHERAERVREYRNTPNARQSARTDAKQAA